VRRHLSRIQPINQKGVTLAIPLKDFRCAISEQVDDALEAHAYACGVDKQAAARKILAEWARDYHKGVTLYARKRAANGAQLELDGVETADDGIARLVRK